MKKPPFSAAETRTSEAGVRYRIMMRASDEPAMRREVKTVNISLVSPRPQASSTLVGKVVDKSQNPCGHRDALWMNT
jgi:hypothetical protein